MKIERRKHPRYRVGNAELLVVSRNTDAFAFVRDAGPGGMQIQYTGDNELENTWDKIDIIGRDRFQILMSEICCQVAYSIRSLMENGFFRGADVRLCGLKFHDLSPLQKELLPQLVERAAAAFHD